MDKILKFSTEAIADIDEIYNYINNVLKNQIAASNTVSGILERVQKITLFPGSGTPICFPNGEETMYRFTVYNNYLAIYHANKKIIYIDRIIYGGSDYIKLLFGNNL